MDKKLCLLICFFVGVLVFYLLKNTCGCKVVEGNCTQQVPAGPSGECGENIVHCTGITDQATCRVAGNQPDFKCCAWNEAPAGGGGCCNGN